MAKTCNKLTDDFKPCILEHGHYYGCKSVESMPYIEAPDYSTPKRDTKPIPPWIVDPKCKLCKGKTFNRLPVENDFDISYVDEHGTKRYNYDSFELHSGPRLETGRCSKCAGYYWWGMQPAITTPTPNAEKDKVDLLTERLRIAEAKVQGLFTALTDAEEKAKKPWEK